MELVSKHSVQQVQSETHLGNAVDTAADREDPVGDSGDDLGDASLDVRVGAESRDRRSTTADDDTCTLSVVEVSMTRTRVAW